MVRERGYNGLPGIPTLLALVAGAAGLVWLLVMTSRAGMPPASSLVSLAMAFAVFFLLAGLFMVNPNQGVVLQLFGAYQRHRQGAGPALGESAASPRRASRCASATSRARI